MKIKKIGILLNHSYCAKNIMHIIDELQNDNNIKLYFLIHDEKYKIKENPSNIREKIYKLLFQIENNIFHHFTHDIQEYRYLFDITKLIRENLIYLQPKSNTRQRYITYSSKDIKKLKAFNLDLILNGDVSYNIKGNILNNASKDGIIGIFYGNNHQTQNEKVAFWEIYKRKSSINFSIEKIKDEKNELLFKGEIMTLRTVSHTKIRLYNESTPYIIKIISTYAQTNSLLAIKELTSLNQSSFKMPSVLQQLNYLLKTFKLYASIFFRRFILGKHSVFSVAFLWDNWDCAKLSLGIEIKNPPNHFYADPFVWTKNGRSICFLEDYDYNKKIATISAVELFKDGSYKLLGEVIKEPFHISFPYLFEYEHKLYMVPESSASNSVRLYKCIEFPLVWEYQKDLLKNINTADTIVFKHKQRWWLFTNKSTKNNDDQVAQLFAYHSDNPLSSEWKEHTLNPIVFNSNFGRNGGILDIHKEFPIRARQKQKFNIYGAALSLAKITQLSPTTYKEKYICKIEPDFFPNIKATHHIHSHNGITVYDYMRNEKP